MNNIGDKRFENNRNIDWNSSDVNEWNDTESLELSKHNVLNDTEWSTLVFPTDKDKKNGWSPIPLESEEERNGLGLRLIHALYQKDTTAINEMLNYDVNIEMQDENGNYPLIISIANRFAAFTKFLLQRGVDMEERNNEGANAFHIAIISNDVRLGNNNIAIA